MTKYLTVLFTLMLLVSSLGVGAQESKPLTVPEAVEEFGSVLEDDGLTLVVIHLNDKSVEALFSTAPNMRALQLQARDATMFFVQGTNGSSDTLEPSLEWQVRQGEGVVETRPVNISNFEENAEVPEGERFSGLIVAAEKIDHRSEFSVENGDHRFTFAFSAEQIEMIEGT